MVVHIKVSPSNIAIFWHSYCCTLLYVYMLFIFYYTVSGLGSLINHDGNSCRYLSLIAAHPNFGPHRCYGCECRTPANSSSPSTYNRLSTSICLQAAASEKDTHTKGIWRTWIQKATAAIGKSAKQLCWSATATQLNRRWMSAFINSDTFLFRIGQREWKCRWKKNIAGIIA